MEKEIIAKLKDYFIKRQYYDFVVLFGSVSTQQMHALSDVDIGVWCKSEPDLLEIGYDIAKLEDFLGKKVDMVILNELYKKDPLFAYEIYATHQPLMVVNSDRYETFKRNALLYYLDNLPLIEQNRRALAKTYRRRKGWRAQLCLKEHSKR